MSSENPNWGAEIQTGAETEGINLLELFEQKKREAQLQRGERMDSTILLEKVPGKINYVAPIGVLASNDSWQGAISVNGENALAPEYRDTYYELLAGAVVKVGPGGQRGCIDGRGSLEKIAPGPKTAGGTYCDAMRVMLASHAVDPDNFWDYEHSLEFVRAVERKKGYVSGGHELDQCGAFKFAPYSISMIADRPDVIAKGVQTFLGAVGQEYSEDIQLDLTNSAKAMKERIGELIPGAGEASKDILNENPKACPTLLAEHKELAVVVFTQGGATLDNNTLIESTKQAFGVERQAFAYNWDFHKTVATELGGDLGRYYLQSVPSQDIPALTQLTDGTLDIVSFQPVK